MKIAFITDSKKCDDFTELGNGYHCIMVKEDDFFADICISNYMGESEVERKIIYKDEDEFNKEMSSYGYTGGKTLSWRDAVPNEVEFIEKTFKNYESEKFLYERKINDKGCTEYTPVLESLIHECVKITKIDYRKKEISFQCLNCGEETTFSFSDKPKFCPHCGAEISLRGWQSLGLKVVSNDIDFDFSYCHEQQNYKERLVSVHQPVSKKEFSFLMDDKEEKLTILCVTNKMEVKNQKLSARHILNWVATYSWKEGSTATKIYGKDRTKECEFIDLILEVTSLNNDDSLRDNRVHWHGAENALTFITKHKAFFEKVGFFSFIESMPIAKLRDRRIKTESLMLKYISLLGQFPTFEQIVKAGHSVLAADIIEVVAKTNKEGIRQVMEKWEQKLNLNTSSGVKALQVPKYVAKYLRETHAEIDEYLFWMENWSKINISKENFEKFVGDAEFRFLKLKDDLNLQFVELLEYGYDPHKLKRYILKQNEDSALYLLKDYLDMCEDLGIDPDPYPYHLKKMHDDIVDICKNVSTTYDEEYVKQIQGESRDLVNETRKTLESKKRFPADFKEYTALFPTKKQEFFNEGNAMHSCVGPYMRNVNAGNNIVFFIREKENMSDSYITAEWSKAENGVGQVLMSNNRECSDEKAYKFATWVANTIQLGVDRGLVSL